jgi:trehalose 6-phosphate phosphatase
MISQRAAMLDKSTAAMFSEMAKSRGPLLIATDLDGTLSPIVNDASAARVPAKALAVLERLTKAARVAVVTGRDLNTARRMVPAEDIVIMGSHGLEASIETELLPEVDRVAQAAALEQFEHTVIQAVPSALAHIERKAISTAFHYRTAPELEAPLRDALRRIPDSLRIREGRMVLEVLPNAGGGKDLALTALAGHFKTKSLLAMGDDLTDVAMFEAGLVLREAGTTVLLAGVSGEEETPAGIRELADVLLHSPAEAREALEVVAAALGV